MTAIFPVLPGLAWSVTKAPRFQTRVQRAVSGRELRLLDQPYPVWSWTLSYSLLRDRGILLNHGISRRAKTTRKAFHKMRPEHRFIAKYIFPGGELDHIGHALQLMEANKFEVHDVEGWREHYAMTTRRWRATSSRGRARGMALYTRRPARLLQIY